MYLVNFFSSQSSAAIPVGRLRTGQKLLGVKDGANLTFTVPFGDKFAHNLPFLSIHVFYNGVRLTLLDDYLISESGGSGTGYDSVTLLVAPVSADKVTADYVSETNL